MARSALALLIITATLAASGCAPRQRGGAIVTGALLTATGLLAVSASAPDDNASQFESATCIPCAGGMLAGALVASGGVAVLFAGLTAPTEEEIKASAPMEKPFAFAPTPTSGLLSPPLGVVTGPPPPPLPADQQPP